MSCVIQGLSLKAMKITPINIPTFKGCSHIRWFVEININGEWRDVGNCETEQEAIAMSSKVKRVGDSWRYE